MSHQLVVKTRLGETQIGLVVLDILNSTVGWCSHIGIFWELKHVETTDIKSHNSSHMGFSIMIQGLTQAKPSSFSAMGGIAEQWLLSPAGWFIGWSANSWNGNPYENQPELKSKTTGIGVKILDFSLICQ